MDWTALALTFGAIFVVELPDKTFLATLVLATKYRPILVWLGVGAAFAVQTTVAVLLGHAASFLPENIVHSVALVMFLAGAVILIREGRSHQQTSGEEFAGATFSPSGDTLFVNIQASRAITFAIWGPWGRLGI